MKLPYFPSWDVTPIVVTITDGTDENGAPNTVTTWTGNCNFQEKGRTVRVADGQYQKLAGVVRMGVDIAPSVSIVSGTATIGGKTYKIHTGTRPRNPDGTINHTKLELI